MTDLSAGPSGSLATIGGYPNADGVLDPAYCERKADKILAILDEVLGQRLVQAVCVDVGCASGGITERLAPRVRAMLGVEYGRDHLDRTPDPTDARAGYVRGDAQRLPLADGVADVVICAQVYEHVADAEALVAEIERVLAPGGVCFFSGPNRLDPLERHYDLLFLSWLPWPLADHYVRAARRGTGYPERPRTYWGLRRLLQAFEITDYTVALLRDPERYHTALELGRGIWVRRLPAVLLRLLIPVLPNYNWILRKGART